MNKAVWIVWAGMAALASCSSSAQDAPHPFSGCWQSEDGLSREVWSEDPSGWMFGYALDRGEAGEVKFFEQMRIETRDNGDVLVVSAARNDSVEFTQTTAADGVYRFENADHDFPQVIQYTPSTDRLSAYISASDGSNQIDFEKVRCGEVN